MHSNLLRLPGEVQLTIYNLQILDMTFSAIILPLGLAFGLALGLPLGLAFALALGLPLGLALGLAIWKPIIFTHVRSPDIYCLL